MALAGALKCFFVMSIAWWRSSPQQNGVGSGKHLRGLLEQSIHLLFPHMPSRYSGGSLYICISIFFFFLYFLLLSPLDWLASLRGETKDAAFHHCYHCGSISASCFLRLTYPGACMSQVLHFPFIVLISLFYRARVAGSIVVSTIAMETISIESCLL